MTSEDIYYKISSASSLPHSNISQYTAAACQLLPPNKFNSMTKFYSKYYLGTFQESAQWQHLYLFLFDRMCSTMFSAAYMLMFFATSARQKRI